MQPKFILPTGYAARTVEFVLSRERNGWKFYGRDHQGYLVPARNPKGELLCAGVLFRTKREAYCMAKILSLPAYAMWNGRMRRYDGKGAEFTAFARDHVKKL